MVVCGTGETLSGVRGELAVRFENWLWLDSDGLE